MGSVVRAVVASVLLLALAVTTLGVAAGSSLLLGYMENHPSVEEAVSWAGGSVLIVVGAWLVARLWLYIYRRLDRVD